MKLRKFKFVSLFLVWSLVEAAVYMFDSQNWLALLIVLLVAYSCCVVLNYSVTDNPAEQSERDLSQLNILIFNQYSLNIIRNIKSRLNASCNQLCAMLEGSTSSLYKIHRYSQSAGWLNVAVLSACWHR